MNRASVTPPGRVRSAAGKLPVPGRWQETAILAMAHLCEARGLEPAQVTITRIDEVELSPDELPIQLPPPGADSRSEGYVRQAIDVWLLGAGRTYRYRSLGGDVMPHGER